LHRQTTEHISIPFAAFIQGTDRDHATAIQKTGAAAKGAHASSRIMPHCERDRYAGWFAGY
jgi:hypothetical protein